MKQNKTVYCHRINVTDIIDNMKVDKPKTQQEYEYTLSIIVEVINRFYNPCKKKIRVSLILFAITTVCAILFFLYNMQNLFLLLVTVNIIPLFFALYYRIELSNRVRFVAHTLGLIRDKGISNINEDMYKDM
jgi:hypothetical protein